MPTKNQDQTSQGQEWTIEDLYNLLMEEIEPDLTTSLLPDLDKIYEGETAAERRERGKHYARCFDLCFDRLEMILGLWGKEIAVIKKQVMKVARTKGEGEDAAKLQEMEGLFDTSSDT